MVVYKGYSLCKQHYLANIVLEKKSVYNENLKKHLIYGDHKKVLDSKILIPSDNNIRNEFIDRYGE